RLHRGWHRRDLPVQLHTADRRIRPAWAVSHRADVHRFVGFVAVTRVGLIAALIASVGLSFAVLAPAGAQPQGPGLSISPEKVELDLADKSVDVPFAITATGSEPVDVVFTIAGLTHDLDGTPQYPDAAAPPLQVAPTKATLVPGTPVTVRVTGSIPAGSTALYAGLVATLERPPASGVDVVTRIGVPLLLRGPQPWHPAAAIEELTLPATQPGQPARVEAVIRNTGDVHIRPSGTFTIEKDGRVVSTARLQGEAVLPGL